MCSGTLHLPDGFISHMRRSRLSLAPSVSGGFSSAGGVILGLAGDGAEILGGGVV